MMLIPHRTPQFICSLAIFTILASSCNSRQNLFSEQDRILDKYNSLSKKAAHYVSLSPDTAIMYADSAIRLAVSKQLKDSAILNHRFLKVIVYQNEGLHDSAVKVLERIRNSAINKSDKLNQAKAALKIAIIKQEHGELYQAEKFLLEAIRLYEKLHRDFETAYAYTQYGALLTLKENTHGSQQYLLKAYQIFKRLDSLTAISGVCINLGNNLVAIGSDNEALKYYRLAYSAALKKDVISNQIAALRNIGLLYRHTHPDSALYYYNLGMALEPANHNILSVMIGKFNIANIYLDKKDYTTAGALYQQVLRECTREHLYGGIARACYGISSVHSSMGNTKQAINYLEQGLMIADSTGESSLVIKFKMDMVKLYAKKGDFAKAYFLSEQVKLLNDSILAKEKKDAIREIELLSQSEKKVLENENLRIVVKSQQERLKSRFIIILILLLASAALIFLLRKAYNLYQARGNAYTILLRKYEEENEQRNSLNEENLTNAEVTENRQSTDADPLIRQLTRFFESEKPYLDPKLKVDEVADKLKTTQKAIASALKLHNNSNFNTFTNQFRVEEAKRRMADAAYRNYKMEAIATDSGFGTKQSFYNAFEQYTGIQPGYFRSYLLNKNPDPKQPDDRDAA